MNVHLSWNFRKMLLIGLTATTFTGCAVIGLGGEPDTRWAGYQSWNKLNVKPVTGDHTGFLGNLHEGASGVREVYVNDIGWAVAIGEAPFSYPVGTVIAKEQYKNETDLNAGKKPGLTVMVKTSDDAENPVDNWVWSRGYNATAESDTFCSSCHTIAMGSDFVFSNAQSLKSFR